MTASKPTNRIASALRYLVIITAILIGSYQYLKSNLTAILALSDFINSFDGDVVKYNTYNNTYLLGDFAPVTEESNNIQMSVISGSIPNDLSGLFLRIGPNPIPTHNKNYYHWFDGHGMIHSIRIQNNSALYSNQYIHTKRFEIEKQYDRSIFINFGEMKGVIGLIKILVIGPLITNYFKIPLEELGKA